MIYLLLQGLGALFFLGFVYYTQILIRQLIITRKFKGPLPLPFVGNCYSPETFSVLKYLSKMRKKFGKIFTFFTFTRCYVVVCDPVAVRRVLSDPKTFPKGEEYSGVFSTVFGEGLVTSNGDRHKHDRGLFGKFFVRSFIINFTPMMNELARDAVIGLRDKNKTPKSHNIEIFFATLALRVFALFSMGIDYRKNPEREREICHMVSKGSCAVANMMVLSFLPPWEIFGPIQLGLKVRREIWKDVKAAMIVRKAAMDRGEKVPDDAMTTMIQDNMPEKVVIDHVVTLLAAGHDTTSFFSSYFVYVLGQHQKEQELLRKEILDILGDRDEVTNDDILQMKYLSKCMQEVLRLYAIIPNLTRYVSEDVHIKELGITLPQGVNVFIPMFLMNRDPEIWENPSEFNPDRFEPRTNEFTSAKNGFFPFGYGSRTCMGNTLAQIESSIFICHLLKRFRVESDPKFKPQIMSGISLTTSNGIHVILHEL